jgi:hypothetical protein
MGMAVAVPPPSAASALIRATGMGRLGVWAMEVAGDNDFDNIIFGLKPTGISAI